MRVTGFGPGEGGRGLRRTRKKRPLGRRAHELASDRGLKPTVLKPAVSAALADVENELDERVARFYAIAAAELAEIKKSLEELRS